MKVFSGQSVEWNKIVKSLPNAHLLQCWEWAQFKSKYGWISTPLIWDTPDSNSSSGKRIVAAAMTLKRNIPLKGFAARLCIIYIPRGPVLDWQDQEVYRRVLSDLQNYAKKEHAIFLKIDPDLILGTDIPGVSQSNENIMGKVIKDELASRKWIFSKEQIQFRNTAVIDLSLSEDEIKDNFKQKTRYNINLAARKGVIIRRGSLEDLHLLYAMYAETSIRDGFVIREEGYYLTAWKAFMLSDDSQNNLFAQPLIAEFNGEPVAAVFIFGYGNRAYYLYGMSRSQHREKMPNYLLQWEAIKLAQAKGCLSYDIWGAPDEFNEQDPLWGVFRFKVGLGATVIRTLGAWDFPTNPMVYNIYTRILPMFLDVMRLRGKSKTKRSLGI
jgi:peptidoglycan pentaglycine glycine transferase (the first glycine)